MSATLISYKQNRTDATKNNKNMDNKIRRKKLRQYCLPACHWRQISMSKLRQCFLFERWYLAWTPTENCRHSIRFYTHTCESLKLLFHIQSIIGSTLFNQVGEILYLASFKRALNNLGWLKKKKNILKHLWHRWTKCINTRKVLLKIMVFPSDMI